MPISAADSSLANEFVDFLTRLGCSDTLSAFQREWGSLVEAAQVAEAEPSPAEATPAVESTPTDSQPAAVETNGPTSGGIDLEADMWEGEDSEGWKAPEFSEGAGLSEGEFNAAMQESVQLVPTSPYLKKAAPEGGLLESFDLRVIYEAGKTGFEEAKEFPIVIDSVIAGRYQVIEFLGQAAFSRAVQCLDLKHNHHVCVKIIRNSKDFFDQALDEIKLLQTINCAGDPDENRVLHLYDYFYHREHVFLVCELLRDNLYEFAKFNREQEEEFYFTIPRIQSIAKQVVKALNFIHSLNLIHCDLKPENILIRSYSRCEVKVIDFGSSCFLTDKLSSYIQSRSYRAPEVVLGCKYDGKIDIWSMGAILIELITGHVLFNAETLAGMLAKIVSIRGRFTQRMLHEGRHASHFVTKHGAIYERDANGQVQLHYATSEPSLEDLLLNSPIRSQDELFLDFLDKTLQIDPANRWSAEQLLNHEFLNIEYGDVFSSPPKLKNDQE